MALTPVEKQKGFLEYKEQQLNYEKRRLQDFKQYKKFYNSYKNKTDKDLEDRHKVLSKLRKFKVKEIKKQKLEKKWEHEKNKLDGISLQMRRRYIKKRNHRQKKEAEYPIKELQGIIE